MSDDQLPDPVPGQHDLGPTVERFDEVVDQQLERVRGNSVLDRVFTTASHVGDFSLIWHSVNLLLGIRARNPRRVITFAALIGLESLVVNQGVKRLFRRARPTTTGDDRLEVRQPRTSSFPSGHASSATFAAALLAPRTHQPVTALVWLASGTVATSRAYVRIHHASDVVAGVITGGMLVAITHQVIRRLGRDDLL
jgi:membrane-associated phospholipid phosphatase